MKTPLLDALHAEVKRNRHRFHVPFHAGQNLLNSHWLHNADSLFGFDLTELPALDVLGHPQGVLRESQAAVAQLFGSRESFYLVNGASSGIMAALLACGIGAHKPVLVARNCHRSVIHGLILAGVSPQWLVPQSLPDWGLWGAINPQVLDQHLQAHPQIAVFVMTHPTYEGIPSDVEAIAAICHHHNVMLIVDEAHGSLFPLVDRLPPSAITAGADAVIHSLHKSGGSLTQTALLHLPHASRLQGQQVQQALNLLQTTSPSYLLLANMEATCHFLANQTGKTLINEKLHAMDTLRQWMADSLHTLQALAPPTNASGFQLFVRSTRLPGDTLAQALEEIHNISYEAVTPHGVLLLLNLGLSPTAVQALQVALTAIDTSSISLPPLPASPPLQFHMPQMYCSPAQAFYAPGQTVKRTQSQGRVCKQIVATCPPGIPILIPGEVVASRHLPHLPDTLLVMADTPDIPKSPVS